MAQLLVVDDEPAICWGLSKLAEGLGYEVQTASSAEEAIALTARCSFQALMLDVRLPGMDGLAAIEHLRPRIGSAPIIVMTAYGDLATAVEAVRQGAFEYLLKPFDLDVAQRALERAFDVHLPATDAAASQGQTVAEGTLVGKSTVMQDVFRQIALVADSDACVHVCGESGSGKELVARAIHRYSRRHAGPFVAVNLASLSESLSESELFGHVRGAFTGAAESRHGLLEQAHGGTIFLDEVADIPLSLQVKLLRVLEYGELWPVGASAPLRADFRVISATHQDLSERVSAGRFRHDLFFRLNTFQVRVPSLRERRDDIAELANLFLTLMAERSGVNRASISAAAMTELRGRPWHGNVRELRNVIEHATILARGAAIRPEHLPPPVPATGQVTSPDQAIAEALRAWARAQWSPGTQPENLYDRLLELIEPPVLGVALEEHQGQCAAAARSLGLHRITLRKKLQQYGLGDTGE
jgi:two-component system nitrogen regulation response regulator GlnG